MPTFITTSNNNSGTYHLRPIKMWILSVGAVILILLIVRSQVILIDISSLYLLLKPTSTIWQIRNFLKQLSNILSFVWLSTVLKYSLHAYSCLAESSFYICTSRSYYSTIKRIRHLELNQRIRRYVPSQNYMYRSRKVQSQSTIEFILLSVYMYPLHQSLPLNVQ